MCGMMPNLPISELFKFALLIPLFVWLGCVCMSLFINKKNLVLFPAFAACFIAGVIFGAVIRLLTLGLAS